VSLADGLLEQPASANISAAPTTKTNRLILISLMRKMNRASICGANQRVSEECGHQVPARLQDALIGVAQRLEQLQ
jgi:hypothetical protein